MQIVQILNEATGRFKLAMSVLFHSESDERYSNRFTGMKGQALMKINTPFGHSLIRTCQLWPFRL